MCSLIHGVNARNQWRLISSSRPLTTVLSINRQLNNFPIAFPYNLPVPQIFLSTSEKYMSTATQRLKATSNHFQSQVNMAANNFYSVVAGVGVGTGRSVAIKFAKTYPVALLARNPANYESIVKEINAAGGQAIGIATDVSSESAVKNAFAEIEKEFKGKKLAAAIFNVGGRFVRKPFLEMTLEEYEAGYVSNGKGFYLFAQATLPLLLDAVPTSPHPPSLIITGATASLRGGATMSSFASGKFALRATGQSLAREFGPKGIHVAHAIIDGVIDIPRTHDWPVNGGVEDGKIKSDAIADGYWYLHTQPRSHFTQELDVRPYVEKF